MHTIRSSCYIRGPWSDEINVGDFIVIGMWFCVGISNSFLNWTVGDRDDVIPIFQMAATASQIYFRFLLLWHIPIKNVKNYLHTKFRWGSSIRGSDTTISRFRKQAAAILKFYFRFPLLRLCHHRHVILRRHTKFHPNRTIRGLVMTS